ncbi:DUF4097 family beta strand repeat-containing protein [Actinomadura kijaniata]|uniref:DUF4097 domain-containing protein n=1 Tax=Actinomadura namibiensis TaxID=182080 RepID=A0A7W3QLD3_ACTNM|nr:DUF4097 family beta strand repeat-containing protein [Actinomadura namibiensis]MBA8951342.1 hypothetical protein [Actinomadura namibiensis]
MRTLTGTRVLAAATVALTTMALTGCGNVDFGTETGQRTYDVTEKVDAIKVDGGGAVAVTGWDSPTVQVHERTRWSNDSNKPDARHAVNGGTLSLTTRCARTVIGYNACGVSYEIRVPRSAAVSVHTDDGTVRVSGLKGALTLRTDTGRIIATGLDTPSLNAVAEDGDIRIDGRARTAELRTDTGGILAKGLRSDHVNARTGDGAVHLAFAAVPAVVRARTDTGAVHLKLPADVGYAFSTSTDTGSRHIDRAFRRDNGSAHRVTVTTGDGSISINPA